MATAYELLSNDVCDDILTVDLETRQIIIPDTVENLGVESDDSVRILHFKVPRHYCEVDLSTFAIRVNYKNTSGAGGFYEVKDSVVNDDLILFDWVVDRHVTVKRGNVVFNVCLREIVDDIVEREFNTAIATLPVLEGLETGEYIMEEYPDIFEQLREAFADDVGELADVAVREYIATRGDEIKGPKGDAFEYEDFTPEQLEALRGPVGASLQSIRRTSGNGSPGTTDTYTITMTNGATATFKVYNGKDGSAGSGSGDMLASMYDPQNKRQDIFQYVDNVVGNSGFPNLGENITEGYVNDTVVFWANKGSGQAWFSTNDMLVNQPCQYGFVISYVHDSDVFQMFSDQNDGVTYFRYGDGINNWFKHWTALELPGMATTTELGLVMVNGNNGIGVNTENGNLFIKQASNSEIDGKEHSYKPITPENLDYAVKAALVNNANDLSDTERASVLDWIGAISKLCVQKESGDITDLLGTKSCRYIFGSAVTGMPTDNEWWFADVLSNGYTDLMVIATSITSEPVQYVRTCVNNTWGSWHKVPIINSDGSLNTGGNIQGHYLMGEWIRTMSDTHLSTSASKIAVLNDEGWIYHRTPAELRSDINAYSKTEVDNAIATAIGNAIGGSY